MSIIAKGSGSFVPAPDGLHGAVCVDVVDLGMVTGQFGTKHKIRIVWEIDERMNDGKPFIVGKQYTLSLHEKAQLHKDLKAWRGKPFTQEELDGFDVERVIGAPCQILIQHEDKDGVVYANVQAITRADKRTALQPSGQYTRVKDRDAQARATSQPTEAEIDAEIESGEAIPF